MQILKKYQLLSTWTKIYKYSTNSSAYMATDGIFHSLKMFSSSYIIHLSQGKDQDDGLKL